MKKTIGCMTLGTLIILAGCGGGDSEGGSCKNTAACGGDVVGKWTVSSSCLSTSDAMVDGCPAATVSLTGVKVSGGATYNTDLTYTSNVTPSGNMVITLPASCLNMRTCAQVTAALQAQPGFSSRSCVAAGSGCACTIAYPAMASAVSGTYTTTAAGVLSETDTGASAPDVSDYCVKGNTLSVSPHADMTMNMGGMGKASLTATIVLTKQ